MDTGKNNREKMISFIISYRQTDNYRKMNLDYLIQHLNSLDIEKEIIIVEQDCEKKYVLPPGVKKIFIKNGGTFNKSLGYNIGAKYSKYDLLFFNDSDVIMDKHNYFDCVKEMDEFDVVDPYRNIFYYSENKSEEIRKSEFKFIPGYSKKYLSGVISGGCFLIKKKTFNEVKGFDEDCIGYGYEDDIFDIKIKKLEYKIKYNWENYAIHLYHPIIENKYKNYFLYNQYMKMNTNQLIEKINNTKW